MSKTNIKSKVKKNKHKNVTGAIVHIDATYNNTIITVTDKSGNTIVWSAPGMCGFRGARRSMPFAAQVCAEDVSKKAIECGVKNVDIVIKGPGVGRESALRALQAAGLIVGSIRDITPIPHNGCRPKKRRRV